MKILFVGQLGEGQTTRMRMQVLAELGHDIVPLDSQKGWNAASYAARRVQQKLARGPVVSKLNADLLALAKEHKPDLLWAEKQEYLCPNTLREIQSAGTRLLHFTPDPYFTLSWKRTPLMDEGMTIFDFVVTSKQYELDEYRRTCRHVIYMPLGFAEAVHRPISPANAQMRGAFNSDVGFLGGWEPRREELLDAIAQTNCNLKIWGYAWDHLVDGKWSPRRALRLKSLAGRDSFHIHKNARLAKALQSNEVYGDKYAYALSGARISVGFLRHVCPDQHTTRTFEIPACGSMMIADRTEEHCEFFAEGKEAEIFSSKEELVDKVKFYLQNENAREKIAVAGYNRCVKSKYDYKNRIIDVLYSKTSRFGLDFIILIAKISSAKTYFLLTFIKKLENGTDRQCLENMIKLAAKATVHKSDVIAMPLKANSLV